MTETKKNPSGRISGAAPGAGLQNDATSDNAPTANRVPENDDVAGLLAAIDLVTRAVRLGDRAFRLEATAASEEPAVAERLNGLLDAVADRAAWYESILDAIPFPLSVTDLERKWTFINRPVEAFLGVNRADVIGTACNHWKAPICNTADCGINCLLNGTPTTFFDQQGGNFRVDTAFVTDAHGRNVGHVEVVQDVTSMVQLSSYLTTEVGRMKENLARLAQGSLALDLSVTPAAAHTAGAHSLFTEVNRELGGVAAAIQSLVDDAGMLTTAAVEGRLATRADASKHQGDYRKIVEGVNETLDALTGFIDNLPVVFMNIDNDFTVQYMNKTAASIVGTTKEAVIGKKCHTYFNTAHCQTAQCACARAKSAGQTIESDTVARPNGLEMDIHYAGIPIRDRQGRLVGVSEFAVDQSVIRQAERVSAKIASFQDEEVRKVVENLQHIAVGNLKIDTVVGKTDKDTATVGAAFTEINRCLEETVSSIGHMAEDAGMLSQAAVEGRLETRADASKHQGDYRKIVEGVNATLDGVIGPVNEAIRVANAFSNADFTVRVSPKLHVAGDFVRFKEALDDIGIQVSKTVGLVNDRVVELAAVSEEANASVEEVTASAQQVAHNAEKVNLNAEKGSNGLNQVLKAMTDLSAAVEEVTSSAESVSHLSKNANVLSKEGAELAQKADRGMKAITGSTADVDVIIGEIKSEMQKIGKIVGLISDLANQTNLLALNAAIEAARAGDAGRGFAVVAAEVKSLAQESRASAENIADMISELQRKSERAGEATAAATREVQAGSSVLQQTLEVFNQIVVDVDKISKSAEEVAAASEEQAATVEEITASIHEVGSLVDNTSNEAGDAAAASEEATASIEEVRKIVENVNVIVDSVSREMARFTV